MAQEQNHWISLQKEGLRHNSKDWNNAVLKGGKKVTLRLTEFYPTVNLINRHMPTAEVLKRQNRNILAFLYTAKPLRNQTASRNDDALARL